LIQIALARSPVATTIGINGLGRLGFRVLWGHPGIDLVQVNDPAGDAAAAHLLDLDSVHSRGPEVVDVG
jgi:glyceraldehyde 3-phosphate dehydrogenase